MVDDKPNSEPLEASVPGPIDPHEAAEAVKAVNEAMAILPKRRFGCLARFAKFGAILVVLLAVFVYWNFLRTPRLIISKETTYITEPLTSDGTRVDYFAAFEQEFYPPEMKTDDNGYRLIVRALGTALNVPEERERSGNIAARATQVYKKLGLETAIKRTMTYIETYPFLREYSSSKGLDEIHTRELEAKVYEPWTLDELPMMGPWLEKNGPVIDLVGEAVRKPAFYFPLVRPLEEANGMAEIQRTRSLAMMIQTRAHYRIGMGDIDGAIYDVITCKRLGRHMQHQGTLIAWLVGIAFDDMATSFGVTAARESQPTEEQLQRFIAELNSLPPRPDLERVMLAERYIALDSLQAVAQGDKSLASLLAGLFGSSLAERYPIETFGLGVAARLSVDWNIAMRRQNAAYDDLDEIGGWRSWQSPNMLSLGNLFLGVRSERVGDVVANGTTPRMQPLRKADHRSKCMDHLHQITLAMLIYERQHTTLPPAYTVDATGKPLHSWRVLLLPYLGQEELYGQLRLDEPWDSEHNRRFHDTTPGIYQCPAALLKPGRTTYSVVGGENTAFGAGTGRSLEDFGMHLILVVEREQSVCWMDPASELSESIARTGINRREDEIDGMGSPHPAGLYVGRRNGSVTLLRETIEPVVLQGLLEGTAEKWPR
ncbi:MAG: DUF1559 family PulG-like putative transporter [Pirellulaceae bacterium]